MTIEANGISLATSHTMTSCLPGADSGGSQGSTGLASLNESAGTLGSGSVNASPGLSPNDQAHVNTINGLSFSASNLCHSAVTTAASAMGLGSPSVTDSINNNNQLRAAAAAAAAGQLNLSDCDPARFAAAGLPYPGLSAAGGAGLNAMYAAAAGAATYPSNDQNPYPSIAMDPNNSFYSSLGNPSATPGAADMGAAWNSAATALQPTGYYAGYDHPSLAAYGYGTGYDLASRRKNATRESTATLKAWLNEHKKNPYPTKGEKIMLAIITKMTLTQVSTWFANARRRLKKENKMTWEPKNKLDDEDVDVSDDDDKDRDDDDKNETDPRHHLHHGLGLNDSGSTGGDSKSSAGIPIPPSKPKIWSLADTAVCKTPPPSGGSGGGHQSAHPGLGGHHQQYQQPSQPPHSQSAYGGGSGALTSWPNPANFSQFVADPAMMRLRHGMGMGMGYMGLPAPPVSQHGFTPLTSSAAAHVAASPGLNSDGVQSSNDTPPHTPPTLKSSGGVATAATPGSLAGQFGGFNGLHNGYSQTSPSLPNVPLGGAGGGALSGDSSSMSNYSKVLMFNQTMNNPSSFKMM